MTTISGYISKMKKIYGAILLYIDDDQYPTRNLSNLIRLFDELNIRDNLHDVKSTLHILVKIANNHHRGPDFFGKIEKVLNYFKDQIKNYFSNSEIFTIFKSSKKVLLFLIAEKIMIVDKYIFNRITSDKYVKQNYPEYFAKEIKPFVDKKFIEKNRYRLGNDCIEYISKNLPKTFDDNRKQGENDDVLCQIIRNDSVREFESYIKKNELSAESSVKKSIFETNPFLLKRNKTTLIEYAAFFGSIQIFKKLRKNDTDSKSSLWLYAIHSQNIEIIHLLDNNGKHTNDSYIKYFYESIQCHHILVSNYFLYYFLKNEEENSEDALFQSLKYYNFAFIQSLNNNWIFHGLCKYDYYSLVIVLLLNNSIEINKKIVYNLIFQFHSKSNISMKLYKLFIKQHYI